MWRQNKTRAEEATEGQRRLRETHTIFHIEPKAHPPPRRAITGRRAKEGSLIPIKLTVSGLQSSIERLGVRKEGIVDQRRNDIQRKQRGDSRVQVNYTDDWT